MHNSNVSVGGQLRSISSKTQSLSLQRSSNDDVLVSEAVKRLSTDLLKNASLYSANASSAGPVTCVPPKIFHDAMNVFILSNKNGGINNLLVAGSRNSEFADQHPPSQLYRARSIKELPNPADLRKALPPAIPLLNTTAEFCTQFVKPLLTATAPTPIAKAYKDLQLGKLAGLSAALLKPIIASRNLYRLTAAALNSLVELFDNLPSVEMQGLKADCDAAISKQKAMALVKQPGFRLGSATYEEKNNRDVVLAAVQRNGLMLEHASDEFRSEKEVVLAAVQQNGYALAYASHELRNNKEVVHAAVLQRGKALKDASVELRGNKQIVLDAVQRDGGALEYASDKLKNNKEVVFAAVQQCGRALRHASDELKNNKELVLVAIQNDYDSLAYASDELRNDRQVATVAIQKNGHAFMHVGNELKRNKEVALIAVAKEARVFLSLSKELKGDKEVALIAFRRMGAGLAHASDELKKDPEVVLTAVKHDPTAIKYASKELRNNPDFLAAVKSQWY